MAVDANDELIGAIVNQRYRVGALIAQGGMGAVYRAVHLDSAKPVAIKTLLPEREPSAETLARFEREAKTASALHHDNIVEVLDMGRMDDGRLFLVMELVEGPSIGDLIDDGLLHPRRALVLMRQALDGVGHAHQFGLVHRDIKPDNIMVVQAGADGARYDRVKLLDFGVVKLLDNAASEFGAPNLTATGVVFGTPQYMAPEQALARTLDPRADLYSLGIVLFEMLTGRRPFEHDDMVSLLRMHIKSPPPLLAEVRPGEPWWTSELEALVAGALKKKPENRFPSAAAMIAALDAAFLSIQHLPNPR